MFVNQETHAHTHTEASKTTRKIKLQNKFNQNKAIASPDDSSHVAPTTWKLNHT